MKNTLEKKVDVLEKNFVSLEREVKMGFARMETLFEDLAGAVKSGFDQVDERFEKVDERFDKIEYRLDRIENISIGNHERRIENLEDKVLVISNTLKLKK